MFVVTCTACERKLRVPPERAGLKVKCPGCGEPLALRPPEKETLPPDDAPSEGPTLPPSAPDPFRTAAHVPDVTLRLDEVEAEVSVPGYDVLGELGRGGMGVVYKARDRRLKRLVALKMILAGSHASSADLERFRSEAEAIARLQHGHIVQVHEIGTHNGLPFFSLELCAGGSLERTLRGGPFKPEIAAKLVRVLALAMQAAHDKGIIHRDLKPANVLLTADNTPKVTDFGLAKRLDDEGKTRTGAVMGTPSYMAPEQAQGKKEIGPGADIYALGAVLYECLTGRPPFRAATALDTVLQVISDEPVPPRALNQKVPRDLEVICLKCLRKGPAQRYLSARDLADDLGRYLAGQPIRARSVGLFERAGKWVKKNPMVTTLAAAIVLLLAASAVGVLMVYQEALKERAAAGAERETTATVRAEAQRDRDERAQADQRAAKEHAAARAASGDAAAARAQRGRDLYLRNLQLAHAEWLRNHPRRAEALLAACPPAERDWEWHHLQGLLNREVLRISRSASWTWGRMTYSPDGAHLLALDRTHLIGIWSATSGYLVRTLTACEAGKEGVHCLVWSPDGKVIAAGVGQVGKAHLAGKVVLFDGESGERLGEIATIHEVSRLAFSPDSKRLATASSTPTKSVAEVWEVESRKRVKEIYKTTTAIHGIAFGADGKELAVLIATGQLSLIEIETGRATWTATSQQGANVNLAIDRAGRYLAACGAVVEVREVASGTLVSTCSGHVRGSWSVGFSPDGKQLASGGTDGSVRLWDTATGREFQQYRGHHLWVMAVSFHPKLGRLATESVDGTVRVWDLNASRPWRELAGGIRPEYSPDSRRLAVFRDRTLLVYEGPHERLARSTAVAFWPTRLAWSSDGSKLAASGTNGELLLLDARTLETLHTLKGHTGAVNALAFQPGGSLLVSGGQDATLRLWDITRGEQAREIKAHKGPMMEVAFAPSGKWFAARDGAGERAGELKLYDLTGQVLASAATANWSEGLDIAPDGREIVLGHTPDVQLRPVVEGAGGALTLGAPRFLRGHIHNVYRVRYLPAGRRVASVGTEGVLRVWDRASGELLLTHTIAADWPLGLTCSPDGRYLAFSSNNATHVLEGAPDVSRPLAIEPGELWSIALSPKGDVLAVTGAGGRLGLRHPTSGKELRALVGHTRRPRRAAFSADGKALATAGFDRTIRLWDLRAEESPLVLQGHNGYVEVVQYAAGGKQLVSTGEEGVIRVWDATSGKPGSQWQAHEKETWALAVAPEGRTFYTGSLDGTVRHWDLASGKRLAEWKQPAGVNRLALARDGAVLAIGLSDGTVIVRHLRSEKELFRPSLAFRPGEMAFTPDGKRLALGGMAGLLEVWDVASGKKLAGLRGHQTEVRGLAVTPDGKGLIAAEQSGVIRWHDLTALRLR